jgi:hypothetical protein
VSSGLTCDGVAVVTMTGSDVITDTAVMSGTDLMTSRESGVIGGKETLGTGE